MACRVVTGRNGVVGDGIGADEADFCFQRISVGLLSGFMRGRHHTVSITSHGSTGSSSYVLSGRVCRLASGSVRASASIAAFASPRTLLAIAAAASSFSTVASSTRRLATASSCGTDVLWRHGW